MKKTYQQYVLIVVGSIIFTLGVNLFLAPLHLYNGGVVGIAQLTRTFIKPLLGDLIPVGMDIAGIINFIFNIPLMVLAYVGISKKFFYKTALSILVQTIAFSLIPIPTGDALIVRDILTAVIVGGLVSGLGVGFTLQAGGCAGGTDVLGVYFSVKKQSFTVGKLTTVINLVIYSSYALLFNLGTAIYSVIYAVVLAMVCDRYHYQNIKVAVTIITKNKEVYKKIISNLTRGVTYWNGYGGFADQETQIIMTVVSKYEIEDLKRLVYSLDEKAFITMSEGLSLVGNFEKRLF